MDQRFFDELGQKLYDAGLVQPQGGGQVERYGISGFVHWKLIGEDGYMKAEGGVKNLVTSVGDMFVAKFFAFDVSNAGSVAYTTLGVSTIAPVKTDTNVLSAITASSRTWEGSYPQRVNSFGTGPGEWTIWRVSYPAGSCTNGSIGEIGMWTSISSFVARALIDPTVNKTANDTLQVDWGWKFLGS